MGMRWDTHLETYHTRGLSTSPSSWCPYEWEPHAGTDARIYPRWII